MYYYALLYILIFSCLITWIVYLHIYMVIQHRPLRSPSHAWQLRSHSYQRRSNRPGWPHSNFLSDRDYHSRRLQPIPTGIPACTRLPGMGGPNASHGGHHQTPWDPPASAQALTITVVPEEDPGPAAPRAPHPYPQRPLPRASSHEAPPRPATPQTNDSRPRGHHVLRSPGRATPMEEHECHSKGHPASFPPQPMPHLCACQEAQGRYGTVEATQEI